MSRGRSLGPGLHVEAVEVTDEEVVEGWDQAAPWQTPGPRESFVEEWAFRAPRGGVEVFTQPRRGRPRYVGPRQEREVWKQVALSLVDHALRSLGGDQGHAHPTYPAPMPHDPLVTHLARWHTDRAHTLNNRIPARVVWPPPLHRKLHDRRISLMQHHGLAAGTLWRPGAPEMPRDGSERMLPRWWLWRDRWSELHELQRHEPLPAYYMGQRHGMDRFIPILVHEVETGLKGSLRVFRAAGYVYRPKRVDDGGLTGFLAPMTAMVTAAPAKLSPEWRAHVDHPGESVQWPDDWRKMPR